MREKERIVTAVCGCAAKLRYHWWLWRLWSSRFGQRSRRVMDMEDRKRQRVLGLVWLVSLSIFDIHMDKKNVLKYVKSYLKCENAG